MNLRQLIQPSPDWLDAPSPQRVAFVAITACAGLAVYGFTVGYWRDPVMGGYVAVKLPLLILLTLACNGLLNGLLGLLLGTGLGFRQSLLALLTSFALAALILGSLAPITFFLAWNAPTPASPGASAAHSAYLVTHTAPSPRPFSTPSTRTTELHHDHESSSHSHPATAAAHRSTVP